jgi:hypothetical protein
VLESELYLIEIFLPLADNDGRRFSKDMFAQCQDEMVGKFGGVTLYARSPAEGIISDDGKKIRDELVIMEINAHELDRMWWTQYRRTLEQRFAQDEILIRATSISKL